MRRCDWINQVGTQCGLPFDHLGNHGNGLLTTSRDEWHRYMGVTDAEKAVMYEKQGVVWTDKSRVKRCLWSGPGGRCIYEIGHTLDHKEDANVSELSTR